MAKSADLSRFMVPKPSATALKPTKAAPVTSRRGGDRKLKGFRLRKEAAKQLAMLKIETGKDEQDLLAEAVNLLFLQYGKAPIA